MPRWRLGSAAAGLEFVILDPDGRIRTDHQFIEG
jgi:hypothetical protein